MLNNFDKFQICFAQEQNRSHLGEMDIATLKIDFVIKQTVLTELHKF